MQTEINCISCIIWSAADIRENVWQACMSLIHASNNTVGFSQNVGTKQVPINFIFICVLYLFNFYLIKIIYATITIAQFTKEMIIALCKPTVRILFVS